MTWNVMETSKPLTKVCNALSCPPANQLATCPITWDCTVCTLTWHWLAQLALMLSLLHAFDMRVVWQCLIDDIVIVQCVSVWQRMYCGISSYVCQRRCE